ncbi:MAG: gliding motility-associated C-terminal domain-containing protein [Flavobacteriales bacterium]|nr:gliding motility-associated C-terminal domain-containing protein [Flavobacteriales bacterium]
MFTITQIHRLFRDLFLLGVGLHGALVIAQPTCSYSLGNDTTICQGESVTLQAPLGFPSYTWSTGDVVDNISVNASGVYWCQVSYPSNELITNGNFSAGNTGFSTDFNSSTNLQVDGNYYVGANAADYHPLFSGTGTGNLMIVNSGPPSAQDNVWCQTVSVCGGQTYTFSYWTLSVSNSTPARLQWHIDGVALGPQVTLPLWANGWQNVTQTWTTAPGQTSANVCLRAMSSDAVGNDFGIDDISLTGTVVLTDDILVNVVPLPVVDLGPDATLCTGQTLTLDAAVPGGTYLWQDGSTGSSFPITGPGNYSVTVTANNCVASDAITVLYNPSPVVDFGPDTTLCTGQSLLLDAGNPSASYSWQDGSSNSIFNVSAPGIYSVNVQMNNCFGSDLIEVFYSPLPVVDIGPDTTLCAGQTLQLDATTPSATYEWQDNSTNVTLNVSTAGVYSVDVTVNGCSTTDMINVNYNPLPIVDLGPDQTICPSADVLLDATVPGATYLWQDGALTPTYSASTPGPYSVDVTLNNCTASDTFTLSHYALQTVDLGPDVTICQGATTSLSALVPGATFGWSTAELTNSITVGDAGIYWVDATLNGCVVRDSITVFVTPLPVVDLGPDVSLCQGSTTSLTALLPGATFLWNTGEMTNSITVGTAGFYWVDATLNGCVARDSVTVSVTPLPIVDLGPDVSFCQGSTTSLNAVAPGASFLWNTGELTNSITIGIAGTYWVQTTQGGCTASDTILVSVAPAPVVDLGTDQTFCNGTTATLDATWPGASYLWSDGAVTPTITASASASYSVIVTVGNCAAYDTVVVNVITATLVDLGPDVSLCQGEDVVLDATTVGATYLWSSGAVTPSITAATSGTYWVQAIQGICTTTDTVIVTVAPAPVVDLGVDQTFCNGTTATLDATWPGANYLWSNGAVTPTITASASATYSVIVTVGNCAAYDTVVVNVITATFVDLGPDVSLCQGEDVVLDATTAGSTYLWSTGAVTPSITAATSGTYWVQAIQGICTTTDTVIVTVAPAPVVDLGVDQTFCNGTTATLDATWPGATYLWSNGAVTPTITANASATYSVIVTVGNCAAYDTVVVNVITATLVDLGPDVSLCQGEDVLLDATTAGSTYLWSTGAVTPSITAATSGTYWVQAIQGSCNSTDTVVVTVLATDLIDLGADQLLCNGESSILLDATVAGATYSWNTGAVTPTLLVATSGTYAVEVTLNSCSSVDTVYIEFGTLIIDLGADTVLCPGASMVLDLGLPNGTNTWNSAEVGPSFTVLAPGTYWVEHVPLVGCSASDTIVVTYAQGDALDLGPDLQLCDGGSATLDATLPGAAYLWDNASTNALRTVSASGTYSVIATVGQCALYDTVNVVFNPLPVVEIGPDASICPGTTTTFDATTAGATYLWNDGSTGATYTSGNAVNVTVEVTLNGCTVTDNANITILDEPVVELGADSTLCEGTSLLLDVAQAGATYLWSTGSTQPTLTIDTDGTYSVDVTLNGCMVSDAIDVGIFMTSTFSIGGDVVLCPGETIVLDATQANAQHTWSTGANADAISVNGEGIYWVNVVMAGCSASDTVEVSVIDLPAPNLGADIISCEGLMVPLSVDPGDVEVLWSTGSTLSAIDVVTEGAYSVTFSLEGCTATDVINISFNDSITSLEIGPETVICPGQYMNLSVTEINGINYLWSNGSTTSNTTVDAAGIYTVTFTGQCASGTEQIEVMVGDCDTYVNVPNTFTPNNDDINDVFLPVVSGTVENYKLEIFDRWGELIFTTSDPTIGWDGSVKTTIAQDGVYVWKINYRVGNAPAANAERIIGHVTLLR